MMIRYGAVALALFTTMTLAGCGGGEPQASRPIAAVPPAAASISATASSTAQPTPVQVVRAWVTAYNEALRSGDTGAADELVVAGCVTCEYELSPVREVHAAGGRFEGGR
ncbi:hypothetical protein KG112_16605 [Nocardioides sp. zg-ZUI104]|uniref:hypothetical protein n=1 Tax=Nocardioides faecalis TaxID=2803858 RepID=UPI001BCD705A|nr:hypothetical protein [Nocardioides faecalis]MBS4754430.1 hypothetical protein [Nocardioides faecalis]